MEKVRAKAKLFRMYETVAPNADQIDYWNDVAGRTWAELQDLLDRQIEPLGRRALGALAPAAGGRLVDIGCGCGDTTLALAERVGSEGFVTGIDISRPMLEIARRRVADAGLANVEFVEADAQTYAFGPESLDGAFSRFGVMFFEEPEAAFRNIRRALRPEAPLAFVCWRAMSENGWLTIPLEVGLRRLPPPAAPEPGTPGPFAFADPERVRGILSAAGFRDISIQAHDEELGGNTLDEAVTIALRVGPLGRLLNEHPDARALVAHDVRERLQRQARDGRIFMPSATWIVTARGG